MTVAELIKQLSKLPHDAYVEYLWDGAARSEVKHVWIACSGKVVLADSGEVVYSNGDRPQTAPDASKVRFWQTPAD